jgi:4-alpha-glucanotransferase
MKFERASGILLHPTSLPGRFGVGDLGPAAYRFVDLLEQTGQSLWQVLPLGPTGYGDSPYQCFSAFAGNPLLISLERLVEDGLLTESDLAVVPDFPADRVDYGPVITWKNSLLQQAHVNFQAAAPASLRDLYQEFRARTGWWLDDYALFRSIKEMHDGHEWTKWDPLLRDREPTALHFFRENEAEVIDRHCFLQFVFHQQWLKLARYANEHGVKIIGDIPIFVAHDSADVWAHPELYYLDASGAPTLVAGVPPDYFSADGQLWGNPLYRWDLMAGDGYQWWISRIRATLSLVDIVRLDHFRGFEKYWAVPAGETTARRGTWEPGPGADFLATIERALGTLPIIAEDLGLITAEVRALRDQFDLPGMQVLQFAFNSDPEADHLKPYRFKSNSVVYTGTHDNETTVGWFAGLDRDVAGRDERQFLLKYLGTDGVEIHWDLIRLALASVADLAIIPLPDLLGLGPEARMNRPSSESGNWSWRCLESQLTPEIAARLGGLTEIYGRNRARRAAGPVDKVRTTQRAE